MTMVRTVAVIVFGASLAANAFLLHALGQLPGQHDDEADLGRVDISPGPAAVAAGAAPSAPSQRCAAAITTVEQQVAGEQESLRPHLPPDHLFARGGANLAVERQLNPLLARLFGGGGQHTLECREAACKLVLVEAATAGDEDWDQALSGTPELAEWTRRASLAQAVPLPSVGGKAPGIERTIYFALDGPKAVAMTGER